MTTSVEVTDGVKGEGLVPPPPPVPESESMEPRPLARQLWDLLTLLGPLDAEALKARTRFPLGETWREYVRWHDLSLKSKSTDELMRLADREYFDRGLQQGIERGWIIESRKKLSAGECPPEHRPFSTIAGKNEDGSASAGSLRGFFLGPDERKAFEVLSSKSNAARHIVFTNKRALRKSLKDIGQQYPILTWRPPMAARDNVDELIIVDGVTRLELLRDLKTKGDYEDEIKFRSLPQEMTAMEALQIRVSLELTSTSKDQSEEARNAYMVKLEQEGFTHAAIGQLVSRSRSRVSEILNTVSVDRHRNQPSEAQVAEFHTLSEAGFNQRAIAERTGWSQATISNYLSGKQEPEPETKKKTKKPPPSKGRRKITPEQEREVWERSQAGESRDDIMEAMGLTLNMVQRAVERVGAYEQGRKEAEEKLAEKAAQERLMAETEAEAETEPPEAEPTVCTCPNCGNTHIP